MEEKENVSVFKGAIKPGLLIGMIFIVVLVVIYIIDVDLYTNPWLTLILFLPVLIAIVVSGVNFRNENGGYLSYGKAFLFCFIVYAIITIFSTTYNILLYGVFDPELVEYLGDKNTERVIERMRDSGQTQEAIERQYDFIRIRNRNRLRPLSSLIGYFISLLFYSVIALFTTLIVKKSKPVEDVF